MTLTSVGNKYGHFIRVMGKTDLRRRNIVRDYDINVFTFKLALGVRYQIFSLSSDATFQESIDTGSQRLQQTTRLKGPFHGAPSSGALEGNYTDINATVAVDSEVDDGTGDPANMSIALVYGDFGIVSEPQGKDANSLAVNGDITFRELLDGSISVVTDTLLV